MFPTRQNVVEQPRAHLVADSSETAHPHGVRQVYERVVDTHLVVSIHAPTRGATLRQGPRRRGSSSFNPRTHTGCDFIAIPLFIIPACFNPRTHTGCDNLVCSGMLWKRSFNPRTHTGCDVAPLLALCFQIVSIHAPTRGATYSLVVGGDTYIVSIHAPTRGATVYLLPILHELTVSIHAPTRGATLVFAMDSR